MGLFSKTSKSDPRIIVEGIEIFFRRDRGWWEFTYRATEFCNFDPSFTLPPIMQLDAILDTLAALKPEMRARLKKGFGGSGSRDIKLDDGESYLVNLEDFDTEKTFTVSWSDGATWGDTGIDFTIKDQVIIDETWGD